MKKHIFSFIGIVFVISCLSAPVSLLAAVSFDAATNITIPTGSIALTISSGSTANTVTVNDTNLTIVLAGGQSITINSAQKRMFSLTGRTYTQESQTYTSSQSSLSLTLSSGEPTETLTVTPLDEYFSGSGGGGGGGGGGGAGAAPAVPAPAPTPTEEPAPTKSAWEIHLENIYTESRAVFGGKGAVLANVGISEDTTAEQAAEAKYVAPLVSGAGVSVSSENKSRMVNFVNYGTQTTLRLGAGERAGVLYCFQDVYGELPATQDDWDDVVKIANGRWPKQTVAAKEAEAEVIFKKIYLREPDRTNLHDDAAVVVITYGLKPVHRSLVNERAAMKSFAHIYKRAPISNLDWKILRAIAESGATR
ncbi:hypothetical protein KKD19_04710 [Patescibacteria group bacterium]|nr:hypothetical protein [Patescibacteria group bacterium]MBU4512510.1 hypothetical protein [Patescibacteria group bacterium]MCG2693511.1 hypothetical protein [Candidatus Parcubacteria bacterium]